METLKKKNIYFRVQKKILILKDKYPKHNLKFPKERKLWKKGTNNVIPEGCWEFAGVFPLADSILG